MSSEELNLVTDIVRRGRKTVFVGLFRLDGLGINHLRFQVGIELVQLISPFLQIRGGWEISNAGGFGRARTGFNRAGDRFIPDDVSRVLSIQGKKRSDTGSG